jgi:hypothetical protein
MEHLEDDLNMAFLETVHGSLAEFLEIYRRDFIVDQSDAEYPDTYDDTLSAEQFCQLYTETDTDMSDWAYEEMPSEAQAAITDTAVDHDVVYLKTVYVIDD